MISSERMGTVRQGPCSEAEGNSLGEIDATGAAPRERLRNQSLTSTTVWGIPLSKTLASTEETIPESEEGENRNGGGKPETMLTERLVLGSPQAVELTFPAGSMFVAIGMTTGFSAPSEQRSRETAEPATGLARTAQISDGDEVLVFEEQEWVPANTIQTVSGSQSVLVPRWRAVRTVLCNDT